MTRKYVDSLLLFKESELYLLGILHITGFEQMPIKVSKKYKVSKERIRQIEEKSLNILKDSILLA